MIPALKRHVAPLITRRVFFPAGLMVLVGVGSARSQQKSEKEKQVRSIVDMIYNRLSYLILEEAGLFAFANEFVERADPAVLNQLNGHQDRIEYDLCNVYLFSTNFVSDGFNQKKKLRFVKFYDPYEGCTSPFAEFD